MHLFKADTVCVAAVVAKQRTMGGVHRTDRRGGEGGHTNIDVKRDGSWTRSNLDSASGSGWQVSTWINIVSLWSATSPVPLSLYLAPRSSLLLPPSLARSRLFLAHNPRRPVSVYVVHTVPRAERELLSGHSTPLPTVFLDYYRRSCAHNLCFPSTVRKRAVRQRRAHNDATTLPAKTLIVWRGVYIYFVTSALRNWINFQKNAKKYSRVWYRSIEKSWSSIIGIIEGRGGLAKCIWPVYGSGTLPSFH